MNWLYKIIKDILAIIFPLKIQPHVTVPDIATGSPDWMPSYANNPALDWFPYFSQPYHNQEENLGNKGVIMEDNCTVQKDLAIIEALMNWYIQNYPTSPRAIFLKKYYCNSQGYAKLSARYSSKMANIQNGIGANVVDVLNSYAAHGVVPESVYPEPAAPFTFEQYMQPLPPGIEQYGAYSLTLFKLIWTSLITKGWAGPDQELIKNALKYCPIGFASQIGNIDAAGIERPTAYHVYTHCRAIGAMQGVNPKVLNNYPIKNSFINLLAPDFPLPCMIMYQLKIL